MTNPLIALAEKLAAEHDKDPEVEAYLESDEAAAVLKDIEGVLINLNALKAIGIKGSKEGNSIENVSARVILRKVKEAEKK